MALFKVLETDFRHLPNDILRIKYYCCALWKEYQSTGVTCELVSEMMKEFNGDFVLAFELQGKKLVSICSYSICYLLMPDGE
jgi:hypothetical protein